MSDTANGTASDTVWRWTHGGRQAGQGTWEELAPLVAGGQVGADEQVYHDRLPKWMPVRQVPELARLLSAPAGGVGGVVPASTAVESDRLGYYSPAGSLPPRAALVLQGYGQPRGDVGDWPLDELRLDQLARASKARKRVTDAAGLFRALFALCLIGCVGVLIGALFTALGGRRSPPSGALVALGGGVALFGGLTALYGVAAWYTTRSHRWAPITMLVLFLLAFGLNVLGIVLTTMAGGRNAAGGIVANGVGLLVAGAFAATAAKAVSAIPEYLRQPAWCQEVIARVEKRK